MYLHDLIRTKREDAGLSQEELATAMKVTQQTVSRWETGESNPKPPHFIGLSKQLGVPMEEIVASMAKTASEPPKAQSRAARDRIDELEERVVKLEARLRKLERSLNH